MSKRELRTLLYDHFNDVLNRKVVKSCFSDELVKFYNTREEAINALKDYKVTSDGYWLFDDIANAEDDYSQMYMELKNDGVMNCQNYFNTYIYKDDGQSDTHHLTELINDIIDIVKDRG